VDCRDAQGNTPLIITAGNGAVECTSLLVKAGADLRASNLSLRTALHQAFAGGHAQVAELLLDASKDGFISTARDVDGCIPRDLLPPPLVVGVRESPLSQRIRGLSPSIVRRAFELATRGSFRPGVARLAGPVEVACAMGMMGLPWSPEAAEAASSRDPDGVVRALLSPGGGKTRSGRSLPVSEAAMSESDFVSLVRDMGRALGEATSARGGSGLRASSGGDGSSSAREAAAVFLGGACGSTSWRHDSAIPALSAAGVTFYNPQVGEGEWRPEMVAEEALAKHAATVLLFVVGRETRATASCVEAAEFATEAAARRRAGLPAQWIVLVVENVSAGGMIGGSVSRLGMLRVLATTRCVCVCVCRWCPKPRQTT
jgi:hypothetical protein